MKYSGKVWVGFDIRVEGSKTKYHYQEWISAIRFDVRVEGACIEQIAKWSQRVDVRKLERILVLWLGFAK